MSRYRGQGKASWPGGLRKLWLTAISLSSPRGPVLVESLVVLVFAGGIGGPAHAPVADQCLRWHHRVHVQGSMRFTG
jgi:hypothetical protein